MLFLVYCFSVIHQFEKFRFNIFLSAFLYFLEFDKLHLILKYLHTIFLCKKPSSISVLGNVYPSFISLYAYRCVSVSVFVLSDYNTFQYCITVKIDQIEKSSSKCQLPNSIFSYIAYTCSTVSKFN